MDRDMEKMENMYIDLICALEDLARQVREDIPRHKGSRNLWASVEIAELLVKQYRD